MERIIMQYRDLIRLLEEEKTMIRCALSDEPLQLYLDAICEEQDQLEKHIEKLKQMKIN